MGLGQLVTKLSTKHDDFESPFQTNVQTFLTLIAETHQCVFSLCQFWYSVTSTTYNACQLKTFTHQEVYFFVLYNFTYTAPLSMVPHYHIHFLLLSYLASFIQGLYHTLICFPPFTIPIHSCTVLQYKVSHAYLFSLFSPNIRI